MCILDISYSKWHLTKWIFLNLKKIVVYFTTRNRIVYQISKLFIRKEKIFLNKQWFAKKPILVITQVMCFTSQCLRTWFWISSKNLFISPACMGYFDDELIERIWSDAEQYVTNLLNNVENVWKFNSCCLSFCVLI